MKSKLDSYNMEDRRQTVTTPNQPGMLDRAFLLIAPWGNGQKVKGELCHYLPYTFMFPEARRLRFRFLD